tara:strand:+ start:168 stop:839 length:672 start_codon:yes stop_codon:yes gene_type:complete
MEKKIETIDPILRHPELLRSRVREKYLCQGLESRKDGIDREDFARLEGIMGSYGAKFRLYELFFDGAKTPILRTTPFKAYELAMELAEYPILNYNLPEKYKVGALRHIHEDLVDVELPKLGITDYELACICQGEVSQSMGLVQDPKDRQFRQLGEPELTFFLDLGELERSQWMISQGIRYNKKEYLAELLERYPIIGIKSGVADDPPYGTRSLFEAIVRSRGM